MRPTLRGIRDAGNARPLWVGATLAPLLLAGCERPGQPYGRFLDRAWSDYEERYVRPEGYVVDRTRPVAPVTSEGQGYALLRAVWQRDEETFRRVFEWTEAHLLRDDGLYSWLWTPEDGGRVADPNTATDAEQEIAWALVLASRAFDRPEYLERARELLKAVRRETAVRLDEGWYPAAGNWAVEDRVINLSYFVPYAYPYFQRAHPEGEWDEALEAGYRLLRRWLDAPGHRLVPDFLVVGEDGSLRAAPDDLELSRGFSHDAMRIYWRVAVDCLLHDRLRACADPAGVDEMADLLARDGRLFSRYGVSGRPLNDSTSISFYGSLLPAFLLHRPPLARALLGGPLSPRSLDSLLGQDGRYYDRNWTWFGIAVYTGRIAERTPPPEEAVPAP